MYSPTWAYATFPFPLKLQSLDAIGERYYEHRSQLMLGRSEGLTMTYNQFHDPAEKSDDIAQLRALHVEIDQAVAAAFGWKDIDLGHGFQEAKQGVRFSISEFARRTVLECLLTLNHQRHAKEEIEKTAQAVSAPVRSRRKKKAWGRKLALDLL